MTKILITGANGQLANCLKDAASNYPKLEFIFVSKTEFDIEDFNLVQNYFNKNHFDYCLNTAAYTNVDKAESEQEKAFSINAEAVKNLATVCKNSKTTLIHISTDYVFDGKKKTPYLENDATNPINVYGASKLKGEKYIQDICDEYFIFRTSWLYSQYGHNFMKTILKYAEEGKPLTITTEQTGTPTNANDLADVILKIISKESKSFGLYHYSNEGETTWFEFAKEILKLTSKLEQSNLAGTAHYPTFATRPKNSVLDNVKLYKTFSIPAIVWQKSLKEVIKNLSNN